jgi:hypothetical protein
MQSSWNHGSSFRNDDYKLFPSNDDEIFDVMDIKEVTFFLCTLVITNYANLLFNLHDMEKSASQLVI